MSIELEVGTKAIVTVPASSANLGPGFDTLGIALSLYDTVEVEVTNSGLEVEIFGEGAEDLPRDGSHLVVKAIRSALNAADVSAPGLRVVCNNNIPQSRGLGSSASAAVAGVAAGNGLAGFPLTEQQVVQLSSAFEGHPDNAAASVLGNAVVSWTTVPVDGHSLPEYKAVTVDVHKDIKATALVPNFHASTQAVRRVLPSHVTHGDATFNVSRTAVQVVALQNYPELLWEGTRDRLHQPYRADVLPVTSEWVNRLRNRGFAAYLSGAGPTAMVLH
ncbi:TPA: homoserine kinase, partial [Corynebacterium striatum]|nr:homoserine kinase [Corynebacterium striatum]